MKRGNLLRRLGALIACAVLVVGATAVSASETSALAAGPSTLDLEQAAGYTWEEPDADWLDDELLLEAMDAAEDEDSSSAVTDENETTDATDAEDGNGAASVTTPVTIPENLRKVKALLSLKHRKLRRSMRALSDVLDKDAREWKELKESRRRRFGSKLRQSRSRNIEEQLEEYKRRARKYKNMLRSDERKSERLARAMRCNSVVCVINEIL